ncbi:dTDP-4-dehydrorhamnose 3,5-epimerase [Aestuariirhabdus litorea]|uniref:dTDP-4-dehydrorhamnose 3,5-epimerase n=1 Tax=Aestuariirhabdus litorea TaxID=2528527 RepID=A0A3P3VKQ4_9GAMM|nr:dTDP-4-dehydrorhamnose 3,5-epimerase [Aestuariirhabdus litorea]RRJ82349.1 dTDP-4-dehydrorhamnose 3,5-epimerase [Aestuariirhabdus litorea]RWW92514.1 dTDP-4-dehydrorhamnose 3,5-epimerase [Endozoicomonadaceae bacterium GTF-13]
MKVLNTPLPGVIIIEPRLFGDKRGFFLESYSATRYREAGLDVEFVQDNHSRSSHHVLRGLHFQLRHPQGKLVRVSRGSVFDVVADVRTGSPTFGQWFGVELNDDNARQLYIPPGYAHGFQVLSDVADFEYKCTDYYHPEDEGGVAWNDPGLGIEWPCPEQAIVSDKDQRWGPLQALTDEQLPPYLL